MKKLAILGYFLSSIALAEGKVSIQPMYSSSGKVLHPQVGLSVYERTMFKNLSYVGWVGTGPSLNSSEENLRWFTVKNSFEYYKGNFAVGPGFQMTWNEVDKFNKRTDVIFLKASYRLW